jgi:hypothetical protein
MTALLVAIALAVCLLAVLVAGLLRSHAEILRALHELGAGLELDRADGPVDVTIEGVRTPRARSASSTVHTLSGQTLDGEAVAMALSGGSDTLLAFLSSGCSACGAFWEAFAGRDVAVPGGARLVVVTRSLDQESPTALRARAPRTVPVVASTAAWEEFSIPGSPYFAYVDATGRVVGEGSAATWPAVAALMGQARADHDYRRGRVSREGRDDAALSAAGILPGDPSL